MKKTPHEFAWYYIFMVLIITWSITGYMLLEPKRLDYFSYVMFVPALVGVIIGLWRDRSAEKLLRPLTAPLSTKGVMFGLFYPLFVVSGIGLIAYVVGLGTFVSEHLDAYVHISIMQTVGIGILLVLGEEYGWRGFLLPTIAEYRSRFYAATIVGIVWGIWHTPLMIGLGYLSGIEHPLLTAAVQFLAVMTISYPFTYAYFLTRSIVPTVIFHFVWNLYNPFVLGDIYANHSGVIKGNLLLINGEALAGILVSLAFAIWYYQHEKKRIK